MHTIHEPYTQRKRAERLARYRAYALLIVGIITALAMMGVVGANDLKLEQANAAITNQSGRN